MKKPIKILSVFGTRPEAIKMAPLLLRMAEQPGKFTSVVCVTGQHRRLLDQAIQTFQIPIHYNLDVMTDNQKLAELSAKIFTKVKDVIREVRPDLIFVQGDTTTTLVAALTAFYAQIPIAHVEAGLRTKDFYHPFPEEVNRLLTDQISSYCFAPTEQNRKNLLREGISADRIFVTGNTAIDALFMIRERIKKANPEIWNASWGSAKKAILNKEQPLILITAHRRENFGQGLCFIFEAIKEMAKSHPARGFVYPVHLNPNVQEPCRKILSGIPNVYLIEPLEYEPFVYLMDRSSLILTDSGGIQEEALSLGRPVLLMREKTERQEAVKTGIVVLVGTAKEKIIKTIEGILKNPKRHQKFRKRANPYGNGLASRRILEIIEKKTRKI